MDIDLGNSIQLTKEETAELNATRTATPEQLAALAEKCQITTNIKDGLVYITNGSDAMWDPQIKLCQNHVLLSAVIAIGDCRLFYDDGIGEYFIYQYNPTGEHGDGPPLGHHNDLNDTVFAAAMQLWFPED